MMMMMMVMVIRVQSRSASAEMTMCLWMMCWMSWRTVLMRMSSSDAQTSE